MTATLRGMRWWDVEPAMALERALFPQDPWTAETFWSELAHPDTRHYVVAEDGRDLVGYAGLMAVEAHGDVQTLAVAPAAQGRGIGARLLTDLLEEAARRGCRDVQLEVRADNAAALALYRRFGFAPLRVRRGYYAPDGADAVVMARREVR